MKISDLRQSDWWVEEVYVDKIDAVAVNLLNRTLQEFIGFWVFGDLRSACRTGRDPLRRASGIVKSSAIEVYTLTSYPLPHVGEEE